MAAGLHAKGVFRQFFHSMDMASCSHANACNAGKYEDFVNCPIEILKEYKNIYKYQPHNI
jgi:hypothetical protein